MINKEDYEKLLSGNPIHPNCKIRGCEEPAKYIYSMDNLFKEIYSTDGEIIDFSNKVLFLCKNHYNKFKRCDYCHELLNDDYGNSASFLIKGKTIYVCDKCNESEVQLRIESVK